MESSCSEEELRTGVKGAIETPRKFDLLARCCENIHECYMKRQEEMCLHCTLVIS